MKDCMYFEDLLSAKLDGELTDQEDRALEEHLAACQACRQYQEDLLALRGDFAAIPSEPPASLLAGVMGKLEAPAPALPVRSKPRRRWVPAALAAVLALVVLTAAPPVLFGGGSSEGSAPATDAMEESAAAQEPGDARPAEGGAAADKTTGSAPEKEEAAPTQPQEEPTTEDIELTLLTQEESQALLRSHLSAGGQDPEISPAGLSAEGTDWLFSCTQEETSSVVMYSVDRYSGTVTELFSSAPDADP